MPPDGSTPDAGQQFTQVREAYTELERRHTHGKIILRL